MTSEQFGWQIVCDQFLESRETNWKHSRDFRLRFLETVMRLN